MGVDAYLLASGGKWLHVGRAYHLSDAPCAMLDAVQDDLVHERPVPAERIEDYGLAMLRVAEPDDGWLARQVVLFARDCKGETMQLYHDVSDNFLHLCEAGSFHGEREWRPPGDEELLAIDGTCPRCGATPRD